LGLGHWSLVYVVSTEKEKSALGTAASAGGQVAFLRNAPRARAPGNDGGRDWSVHFVRSLFVLAWRRMAAEPLLVREQCVCHSRNRGENRRGDRTRTTPLLVRRETRRQLAGAGFGARE